MKFLPSSSSDYGDYGDYGRWYKPVFGPLQAGGKADTNYVKLVWKSLRAKLKTASLFTGGVSSTGKLDAIASDISFLWQYHANQCWVASYSKGKSHTTGVGVPYPGPYWLSNEDDPASRYSSQLRTGTNLHAGGFTNWWGSKNKLGPGRVSIPGEDFNANWQVYTGKETQRNVTPAYAAKTLTGLKMLLEKQKALYMGSDARGDWTKFWGCFENTYNPLIKMLSAGIATAKLESKQQSFLQELKAEVGGKRKLEEQRKAQEYWKAQESLKAEEKAATRSGPVAPSTIAPPDPSSLSVPTTRRRGKTSRKRALAKKKAKQKKRNLTIAGSVSGVVLLGVIFLVMQGRRAA